MSLTEIHEIPLEAIDAEAFSFLERRGIFYPPIQFVRKVLTSGSVRYSLSNKHETDLGSIEIRKLDAEHAGLNFQDTTDVERDDVYAELIQRISARNSPYFDGMSEERQNRIDQLIARFALSAEKISDPQGNPSSGKWWTPHADYWLIGNNDEGGRENPSNFSGAIQTERDQRGEERTLLAKKIQESWINRFNSSSAVNVLQDKLIQRLKDRGAKRIVAHYVSGKRNAVVIYDLPAESDLRLDTRSITVNRNIKDVADEIRKQPYAHETPYRSDSHEEFSVTDPDQILGYVAMIELGAKGTNGTTIRLDKLIAPDEWSDETAKQFGLHIEHDDGVLVRIYHNTALPKISGRLQEIGRWRADRLTERYRLQESIVSDALKALGINDVKFESEPDKLKLISPQPVYDQSQTVQRKAKPATQRRYVTQEHNTTAAKSIHEGTSPHNAFLSWCGAKKPTASDRRAFIQAMKRQGIALKSVNGQIVIAE